MYRGSSLSPPDSLLMTVQDLCEVFKICPRTVRKWMATGILPEPLRPSRSVVRWRRIDIEKMVNEGMAKTA